MVTRVLHLVEVNRMRHLRRVIEGVILNWRDSNSRVKVLHDPFRLEILYQLGDVRCRKKGGVIDSLLN
jgi:hypothetical protein